MTTPCLTGVENEKNDIIGCKREFASRWSNVVHNLIRDDEW